MGASPRFKAQLFLARPDACIIQHGRTNHAGRGCRRDEALFQRVDVDLSFRHDPARQDRYH